MFNVYNRYTDTAGNLHFTDCYEKHGREHIIGRNKECHYITEDELWERFVIVRRIWMKYNGAERSETNDIRLHT